MGGHCKRNRVIAEEQAAMAEYGETIRYTIFVILLFSCVPAGLYYMWTRSLLYNKWIRLVATAMFTEMYITTNTINVISLIRDIKH